MLGNVVLTPSVRVLSLTGAGLGSHLPPDLGTAAPNVEEAYLGANGCALPTLEHRRSDGECSPHSPLWTKHRQPPVPHEPPPPHLPRTRPPTTYSSFPQHHRRSPGVCAAAAHPRRPRLQQDRVPPARRGPRLQPRPLPGADPAPAAPLPPHASQRALFPLLRRRSSMPAAHAQCSPTHPKPPAPSPRT